MRSASNNSFLGGRAGQAVALIAGVGIGLALMYVLDPDRGARRRSLARDRATRAMRTAGRTVRERASDVRNRVVGTAAELRNAQRERDLTDDVLVARVRSELGHHVEHVRPIEVTAENGRVVLRGAVLRDELDDVLTAVRGVRGVRDVENQLDVRDAAASEPSLQGGR
jgi:osmotically-inducible protein OsmY